MARIFISYAREDFPHARALYEKLAAQGFRPWMDKVDLLAGQPWRPALERAMRESDFFVLLLSRNSVKKRGFVQREIRTALDLWQEKLAEDIYLIPVMLEAMEWAEVPQEISKFHGVELYETDGWEQLTKSLRYRANRLETNSAKSTAPAKPKVEPVQEPIIVRYQPSKEETPSFDSPATTPSRLHSQFNKDDVAGDNGEMLPPQPVPIEVAIKQAIAVLIEKYSIALDLWSSQSLSLKIVFVLLLLVSVFLAVNLPAPPSNPTTAEAPSPNAQASGTPLETNETPAPDKIQPVNVTNVLAERTADGKLLVSITGQAPTAGWRLAPETSIESGDLLIKLKGYPPQGMAAQVISYPAKVITFDDSQHSIQRVIVRGPTTSRSTVPLVRVNPTDQDSTSLRLRIAQLTSELAQAYERELGVVVNRTSGRLTKQAEARLRSTPNLSG